MNRIAKRFCVAALAASGCLFLLTGCGRQPQQGEPQKAGAGTNTAPAGTNALNPGTNTPEIGASSPSANAPAGTGNPLPGLEPNRARIQPPEMILIPAGRFLMGDKDQIDAPPHEVIISSFYLDKYLVTQEKYQKVMGDNPSRWKGDKNPVEQVRWSDAVKYCNKLSSIEGLEPCYNLTNWQCHFEANGYRLPTEAEWEYACRAKTTTAYFFAETPAKLANYAWFDKNSGGRPHPVGQKTPNPWGLFDMIGNVWQWCNDFYSVDYYRESLQDNPRGPAKGEAKSVRGGAFRFGDESCRSGYRYSENPGYADVCFGYDIYGFRCAKKVVGNMGL